MKKLERFTYFTIISIITILGIYNNRYHVNIVQKDNAYWDNIVTAVRNSQKNERLSEDFVLNPLQKLINQTKDTVNLQSLCKQQKMILYVNPNACNVCLDSLFLLMNETFGSDTSKLAIISSATGYRDILVQFANNRYKYPLYCLLDKLKIPACELEMPFLFWLDQDLLAKLLFIPDKGDTNHTRWYLRLINERFMGAHSD
jgi:hypothetical protein